VETGAYQDFYAGVVQSLKDGAPPPVDPRDAIATIEVIEAARSRSQHRSNRSHELPPE
jgi:hypothetical protein